MCEGCVGSEKGAVARPAGVGGRESRRRAYIDVFTASCRASNRALHHALAVKSEFVKVRTINSKNLNPAKLAAR